MYAVSSTPSAGPAGRRLSRAIRGGWWASMGYAAAILSLLAFGDVVLAGGVGPFAPFVFLHANPLLLWVAAPLGALAAAASPAVIKPAAIRWMLIVASLEAFQYREAAAIATVLLTLSLAMLVLINILERWSKRHGD